MSDVSVTLSFGSRNLQFLMPLCYLCKYYFILGYVNVSLVQHLIVLSEIFVENAFTFFTTSYSYCAIWNILGKCIFIPKFIPVTGIIMVLSLQNTRKAATLDQNE